MQIQNAIRAAFDNSEVLLQNQGPAGQIHIAKIANVLVTNAVRFCEENPHEIFNAYQTMRQQISSVKENGQRELFLFAISPSHIDNMTSVKPIKTTRYTKMLAVEFQSKLPMPGLGPEHIQTITLKDITEELYKIATK